VKVPGQHHVPFTPRLWAKWLARFNEAPDLKLKEGIHQFRALIAANERKRR